ncbi:MAG TPA: ASKHA domain-containing protein [Candidatus Methylomirabilis sp.]|nr:ASKHA domain-containing protein [Candidatus Methylomirabilis sp.]
MAERRATFISRGTRYSTEADASFLELARLVGLQLPSLCGGRGKCAKCRCEPRGPVTDPTALELEMLTPEELARGVRLGCQTRPVGEVEVHIQEEVLDKGDYAEVAVAPEPLLRTVFLELPLPALHDGLSDIERLQQGLGGRVWAGLAALRMLPIRLRQEAFRATAVLWEHGDAGEELLATEPGDRREEAYGIAFDIGTTSVVGYLIHLFSGKEIARAFRLNGQQPWGADVLSRSSHAMERAHGVSDLQAAVTGTLNQIITECCSQVDARHVYYMTVVGNPIMHHLALGITPASIAVSPYLPVTRDGLCVRAADLGIALPNAWVYFLPLIGAYVGADTLAVIMATGMDLSEEIQLAVDIGTNGEMVLGSRGHLLACSAPAGPAFEGAEIRHGMRATAGAIDRVRIGEDVRVWTIGDAPPRGICGSGLVDAVAQMIRRGIVDPRGRLLPRPLQEGRLPAKLAERLVGEGHTWEFVLSRDPYVAVTQEDVRQLQLAKGTILCGVRVLMDELGIDASRIARVSLAGAFGNFLDKRSALGIGMLPRSIPLERILGVGNAAGHGSRMTLLSKSIRRRAEMLAPRVEYFELSKHPRFEELFAESMGFE